MKTTISVAAVLLGLLLGLSTAAASPRDKPRRYKVVPLPDGRLEITVTGRKGFPEGAQVETIDLREKLDAAAARECPHGYDIDTDNASSIGIAPDGQGLVATRKGMVRCRPAIEEPAGH